MRGPTHALFGLTTLAAVNAATGFIQPHPVAGLPTGPALCLAAATLGALLPDLDAEESTLKSELGFVGDLVGGGISLLGIGHRGLTHSGLAVVVVFALSGALGWYFGWIDVGLALGIGYASHILLADALTISGVPLLWPGQGRFHLLPRRLCIRTGGPAEALIFLLMLGALIWLTSTLIAIEPLMRLVDGRK